jgi:hypothetical protein
MRVFIGMMEIAGYYSNLKKGLRELGIDTVFVDLEAHPFQYMGHDVPNPLVRLTTYVSGKRAHTPRSPKLNLLIKTFWKSLELPLRLLLMIWAVAKYDVFIFAGAGKSFFYFHDLILLRMLNKKIIFVFNGSDARPPYINGAVMASDRGYTIEQCIQLTKKRSFHDGRFSICCPNPTSLNPFAYRNCAYPAFSLSSRGKRNICYPPSNR